MTMTGGRIRVMLCDDSRSLATLIDHWLEEHDDLEFVGAVQDRRECLPVLARSRPDVVLLDTMGNPRDASILEDIRSAAPDARVIVYSGYVGLLGPAGLPLKPDAFLDKSADHVALVDAIRAVVAAGEPAGEPADTPADAPSRDA
jgi:DNA-binding NarL/FixJ family response regulator